MGEALLELVLARGLASGLSRRPSLRFRLQPETSKPPRGNLREAAPPWLLGDVRDHTLNVAPFANSAHCDLYGS